MSIFSTISRAVTSVFSKKSKPSYTIDVSGTPAGYTKDTSGKLVSTPGTTGKPGISGTYGGTRGGSSGVSGSSGTPQPLPLPTTTTIKPTPNQPGITPQQAQKYRAEEQAFYQRIGYKGGRNYNIPVGATREQIRRASQNAERIPTGQEDRQRFIREKQQELREQAQQRLETQRNILLERERRAIINEDKPEEVKVRLQRQVLESQRREYPQISKQIQQRVFRQESTPTPTQTPQTSIFTPGNVFDVNESVFDVNNLDVDGASKDLDENTIQGFWDQLSTPMRDLYTQFTWGRDLSQDTTTAKGKLQQYETATTEFFLPDIKEKRIRREAEENRINYISNELNRDINSFNNMFGGKELSESEYKEAESQRQQLQTKTNVFNSMISQKQLNDIYKVKREERENPVGTFSQNFFVGLISSPTSLASTGLGLITNPVKEVTETGKGFASLPAQFKTNPYSVSGNLLGSFIGQSLILGGFGKGKIKPIDYKVNVKFIKPADITKTGLSKTYSKGFRVYNEGDLFGTKGTKVNLYQAPKISLKRFNENLGLEKAGETRLNRIDLQTEINNLMPRYEALKRFRETQAKQPKPYTPFKYDIDYSMLKRELNRIKTNYVFSTDKTGLPQLKLKQPRFKAPSQPKPLFTYDILPEKIAKPKTPPKSMEFKPENLGFGEQAQQQKGGQQQLLLQKPEQMLKQPEKIKVIQILPQKQLDKITQSKIVIPRQFQMQNQQYFTEPLQSAVLSRQNQFLMPLLVEKQKQGSTSASRQLFSPSQLFRQREQYGQPQASRQLISPAIMSMLNQPQRYRYKTPQINKQQTKKPFIFGFKSKSQKTLNPFGKYSVFSKRFGKWFLLGKGLNLNQALGLGKEYTGKTLARSFKITGKGRTPLLLPFGYRPSKRQRGVIVEKSRYALSTPTELKEIFGYKGRKRRTY